MCVTFEDKEEEMFFTVLVVLAVIIIGDYAHICFREAVSDVMNGKKNLEKLDKKHRRIRRFQIAMMVIALIFGYMQW